MTTYPIKDSLNNAFNSAAMFQIFFRIVNECQINENSFYFFFNIQMANVKKNTMEILQRKLIRIVIVKNVSGYR